MRTAVFDAVGKPLVASAFATVLVYLCLRAIGVDVALPALPYGDASSSGQAIVVPTVAPRLGPDELVDRVALPRRPERVRAASPTRSARATPVAPPMTPPPSGPRSELPAPTSQAANSVSPPPPVVAAAVLSGQASAIPRAPAVPVLPAVALAQLPTVSLPAVP